MYPAVSIIIFNSASAAGYGLLFLLGIAAPSGLLPAERWLGFAGLALASGLISLGLAASTWHLGRPERAWRALSQWRTSWLSREGVMALATFVPAGLFAVGWVVFEDGAGLWGLCGLLSAAGAALTVVCTGMIYASLKPVRQWNHPLTVPVYLAFSLATGALWLQVLAQAFGVGAGWSGGLAVAAAALAWGLKALYWRAIDAPARSSTPETATGLGALGRVRLLEPPHTEESYLTREMGFRVARKHAAKLRRLAQAAGAAAVIVLSGLALGAALAGSLGILIERWLFFAEARHSVMLYYGAPEV